MAVENFLSHGEAVTLDGDATVSDVLAGKTFYGNSSEKLTGLIPTYSGSTSVSENTTLATAGKYISSDIVINVSSAVSGTYVLRVAELPSTTIKVYSSSNVLLDTYTTDSTTGGMHDFTFSTPDTFTITAEENGSVIWTKTAIINAPMVYNVKGRSILNLTKEQIHLACVNGYAQYMWELKDKWTFVQSGSILNNYLMMIEKFIINNDNTTYIKFGLAKPYTNASYIIDPYFAYLTGADATAFSSIYSSAGGFKYCDFRQKCMKSGDPVYIQATGVKPTDSTLVDGIKFDEFYYTDGNGSKSGIYTYDPSTDSFTEDTEITYFTESLIAITGEKFLKGYFKSVGQITEEVFNAGYYYSRTTVSIAPIYTRETTWVSGTTYYGFYETLQEDGIFLSSLSSIRPYIKPSQDYSSTGLTNTQYLQLTEDLISIPCVEEHTGVNRTSTLESGVSAMNAYAYNVAGEGELLPAYNAFDVLATGYNYWTRSAHSSASYAFCSITSSGYIDTNGVTITCYARVGFIFG
ncbi:MAG: hypothetical protein RR342_01025 [Bacilli bacterium]